MPLQPGKILQNRYRIESLLGQGGVGAVYRASVLAQVAPLHVLSCIVSDTGLDPAMGNQLDQGIPVVLV